MGFDKPAVAELDNVEAPSMRRGAAMNGYAATKWVAERMAVHARTRGLPVAIYRVASLSGSSVNGSWHPHPSDLCMNRSDIICFVEFHVGVSFEAQRAVLASSCLETRTTYQQAYEMPQKL